MIDIKDISGEILKSVIEGADCKKYEELMSLCYISLSWDDENNIQLPAGSYIEYNGEKYRLMEPYDPSFKDESTFQYTPKFYDKIALWSKKPLFLVTDTGEETDWSMTAYPGQFMEAVVRALSKYTGETFTYSVDASIAQSTMEYISFQNKNIFDGLTEIANKWDVEWWVEGNIIHLSKCQYGEPITLEVGKNVGIPTVTSNKDGYFTRFYAFGSTKNITQEYDDGGFTNGLVNKRLTLNPSLYPGGYMDIRPDLHPEEVFVKTLIFDNIFPSSKLVISGVRAELKDYIDSDGNKIQVGESEGEPLYKQYAIWYFKIDGFSFNNSTYDKDDNPEGMLLSGLDLSVIFESGQLNGRDFKLTYHEETQEYEINFVEESGSIIVPGTVSLIPADGDNIVLYNIRMPEEYIASSQEELADALLSEMDRYKQNMNSYSFPSYPVSFYEDNLDMKVGQSVSFIYGGNGLSTRVLKVEKQLDYPIEQTITIGEEKIKGNMQEIKEEVIDANQNIDVVKALADLNKAITDGYGRVQQLIMQSISQYRGLWYIDQHDTPNDPAKWTINTDYTAFGAKDFVAYATAPFDEIETPIPVATDYSTTGLFRAKEGGGLLYDSTEGAWYVDPEYAGGGGIDEEQLEQYLTDNNYITVDYLTEQGYLTLSSQLTGYEMPEAYSPVTAEDTILSAIGKLEANFGNYVDLTTNQTVGGVKTFNETVLSEKDVIAYADGGEYASGLPVADTVTYGLVKVDGTTVRINASGQLEADAGGGIDFTVGTGLDLSVASVLSVKFGTTVGTVCQGNDSRLSDSRPNPYYLSWSGYSSGSYNGSSSQSITIPSNTSQLTNGAGYIKDGNGNFTSLTGSGSSSKYLAGNGTFYTIAYSELSGTPDLSVYVTLATTQTITAQKAYTAIGWYNGVGLLKAGPSTNVHIIFGAGSGNVINGVTSAEDMGNLYFNYTSASQFTRIDSSNNIVTTGDVMAYSTGASVSDYAPVGTTTTYGLLKYDGTTIGKNSSGQLYVISSGSGGTSVDVSWGTQNAYAGEITIGGTTYKFIKSGAISATANYTSGTNIGNINIGGDIKTFYVPNPTGIGTSTIGASDKPIYLSSGSPTACSATKGSASLPVYMSSGTITACTASSLFSAMSVSGSTLYVTVAGQQRSVTLPSSGGSTITSVDGLSGGTITGTVSVGGSSYQGLTIIGGSYSWAIHIRADSGSGYGLYFGYGGTSSHKMSLSNAGALYITGALSQNSDIRLKTVVRDIENVLEGISKVRVFEYYLNSDSSKTLQIGYSAQEVVQFWSANVGMNDGYYTLNYGGMGAIAFQGVKELYTRFLPVENKVKTLESRVQNLQLRLDNAYLEIFELKQQKGGAA